MFVRTLRSELLRILTGRTWWILAASGILMSTVTAYGYAENGREVGLADAVVTGDVVRAWMMMFLFSSLLGGVLFTRDAHSGALSRSVILTRGRTEVYWAKASAAIIAGAGFGTVAALLGVATALAFLPTAGMEAVWSTDAVLTVLGVFLCSLIAAPFGLFVGMIVGNTAGASALLLLVTLLVDPGLQRLVPEAARYLFTIALSAVYRDAKPELLSMPLGALVAVAWVLALGCVGYLLLQRRDLA